MGECINTQKVCNKLNMLLIYYYYMPVKLIIQRVKAAQPPSASKIVMPVSAAELSKNVNAVSTSVNEKAAEIMKIFGPFNDLLRAILSGNRNGAKYIAYVNPFIEGSDFDLEHRGLLTKLVGFMSGPPMNPSQIVDALNTFYWTSDEPVWDLNLTSVRDFMIGFTNL